MLSHDAALVAETILIFGLKKQNPNHFQILAFQNWNFPVRYLSSWALAALLVLVALYSDTRQCDKLEPGEGEQWGVLYDTALAAEKGVL